MKVSMKFTHFCVKNFRFFAVFFLRRTSPWSCGPLWRVALNPGHVGVADWNEITRNPTRLDKPILNSAQLKNEEHFNLLITFILNEVQPTGTSNFPHLKIKFDLPLTEDSSLPFASFTWLAQPPN